MPQSRAPGNQQPPTPAAPVSEQQFAAAFEFAPIGMALLRAQMLAGAFPCYQRDQRFLHREGQVVWTHISCSLVHDPQGQPARSASCSPAEPGWAKSNAGPQTGACSNVERRLTVIRHDDGRAPAVLSVKLFTPFQRLHAAHEFAGTGIGLAVVRKIAPRHGGWVWGESTPGAGAVFRFTLDGA